MAQTCGKTASTIPTTTTTATTTYRVRHGQMTWKGWVNTGERGKKCTARHHPRLTIRRSSDTWNEPPHAEQHVADHNPQAASAQPQYTSQYTPHHTSHTRAPPSSPPRHVNDSGHRPTHTHHAPVPYSRPDTIPAAQSGRTYRSADLTSSYRPDTFTDLSPQNSHSRSGIESFLWRPNHEEQARNNALNQSILDPNSQVIDSDNDSDDDDDDDENEDNEDMPRTTRAAAANTVDLTQSPNIPTTRQSRTRKRNSSSDEGAAESARKRARRPVVVDVDEAYEDEAPSADAELLQAQQADALKMQETNKEDAVVKIGKRNCIICLENYTNATTASCGKQPRNEVLFWKTMLTMTFRPHLLPRMSDTRFNGFGEEQRPQQGELPGLQKGH
jgi:hypothetical protein